VLLRAMHQHGYTSNGGALRLLGPGAVCGQGYELVVGEITPTTHGVYLNGAHLVTICDD